MDVRSRCPDTLGSRVTVTVILGIKKSSEDQRSRCWNTKSEFPKFLRKLSCPSCPHKTKDPHRLLRQLLLKTLISIMESSFNHTLHLSLDLRPLSPVTCKTLHRFTSPTPNLQSLHPKTFQVVLVENFHLIFVFYGDRNPRILTLILSSYNSAIVVTWCNGGFFWGLSYLPIGFHRSG